MTCEGVGQRHGLCERGLAPPRKVARQIDLAGNFSSNPPSGNDMRLRKQLPAIKCVCQAFARQRASPKKGDRHREYAESVSFFRRGSTPPSAPAAAAAPPGLPRRGVTGVHRQHRVQRLLGGRQVQALLHQDAREHEAPRKRQGLCLGRRFQHRATGREFPTRPCERAREGPRPPTATLGMVLSIATIRPDRPSRAPTRTDRPAKKRGVITLLLVQRQAELRHGVLQAARFVEVACQFAPRDAAAQPVAPLPKCLASVPAIRRSRHSIAAASSPLPCRATLT